MNRSISNVGPISVAAGLSALAITGLGSRSVAVAVSVVVLLAGTAAFRYGRPPSRSISLSRRTGTPAGRFRGRSPFEFESVHRSKRPDSIRHRPPGDRPGLGWIARVTSSSDRNRRNRRDAGGGRDDETTARRGRVRAPSELTRAEAREILDVGLTADDAEIKGAYRHRIKDVHPDNGGDRADFLRVKAAYERLID